jgi:hydroxymethylpyrimidine pyrophosphatase-like HAD family hydrolase
MRYLALATDYDDTLATSGRVTSETKSALSQLTKSGRRLLLLTARTLEELVTD